MDVDEIATPTTVKGMSKYLQVDEQNTSMFSRYYKGTPVHVKAALAYNDLLKHFKRDKKYSKIENISKIKWVYLKKNQYGLETLAYKGHEDPIEILTFIRENVNYDKIYSKSLKKKITMFYDTMNWDEPTDASKTIERFF
jgi:DNA-directed RNA polymerase delta subunit